MRIAVIFNKCETEGGAFQYALSISLLLKKGDFGAHEFIFFTTIKKNVKTLAEHDISAVYLPWSNLDRIAALLLGSQLVNNIFVKTGMCLKLKLDKVFQKHGIDLIYFLSPTDLALALNRYNYIFTVLDLCFLDSMEFPEVYANREFERRAVLYRLAVSKAVAVVTDSEFNKRNIVRRYGIQEDRAISLPFLPSNAVNISKQIYDKNFIDIGKKYNIDGKYVFYPAQFWPHKNHIYILEGLRLLREKYKIKIYAVFSGSDKGNLSFILRKAKELGMGDQVRYIGFVKDNELPYLYTQALALVMPTYFSPTNIPPLEAFVMNCPVLYSDLPGLRDQVKDAALPLNLKDPESLCRGLMKVIEKSPEISALIENGKKKIENLLKEDHCGRLKNIFDDYMLKSRTWK